MKHKIKCIEKVGYYTIRGVERGIIYNYLRNRPVYSYYECPICLSFHLTKKHGDRRSWTLKKKCIHASLSRWFKSRKGVNELLHARMKQMYTHLKIFIQPQSKNVWKQNGWTKKNSTLPLVEQKKLIRQLHKEKI